MQTFFQKYKTPSIIGGALIVAFFFYNSFIASDATPDLKKSAVVTKTAEDNKNLLNQLQTLSSIKLSGDIFASSKFIVLEDNSVVIENRPAEGRLNPFLPIQSNGQDGVISPSSITFDNTPAPVATSSVATSTLPTPKKLK